VRHGGDGGSYNVSACLSATVYAGRRRRPSRLWLVGAHRLTPDERADLPVRDQSHYSVECRWSSLYDSPAGCGRLPSAPAASIG